jgi:hypothetical protein
VCARFAPCLHNFFLETFRAPAAWFEARLAYTRATAVSSMAGYLIGLGDRHSANILLDRRSAQVGGCGLFWLQPALSLLQRKSASHAHALHHVSCWLSMVRPSAVVMQLTNGGSSGRKQIFAAWRPAHAQVVHIDLGVAFEQGRFLNTPELVPFRLTRDLVDGMGAAGAPHALLPPCQRELIWRWCPASECPAEAEQLRPHLLPTCGD